MFHFYTAQKRQKTKGFLTFSGSIEMEGFVKMGEAPKRIIHDDYLL